MAIGVRSLFPIILIHNNDFLETIIVYNRLIEITIRITDSMNNFLYQKSINPDLQKTLIIPLSNFKEGKYEIKFTDSQGKFLKGEFVIRK